MATRTKVYPYRKKVIPKRNDNGKRVLVDDVGGVGEEIVRELLVCNTCAVQHEAPKDDRLRL